MNLRKIGFFCLSILPALHCSSAQAPNEVLPCDVSTVLATNCQSGHGAPPLFGAPMPLMTFEDLHAPAPSDPSQRVYQRVGARIHASSTPMPPPPKPHLNAASLATLDHWIAADAPPG